MNIKLNKTFASNSPADEFDVKQIKKALNRLGYYQPFEKTGITGIPDADIFVALKAFQTDHGLQATGIAKPDDRTVKTLRIETSKKKEGKYIWRSVGDTKVRDSHAALNGTIRNFSDTPDPGEEPNCRCWAQPLSQNSCDEERKNLIEMQTKVRELSEKLNDILLRLDTLKDKQNALIASARKSLGAQAVAFIITLPLKRIEVLNELLQRYFGKIVSNEFNEAANRFMQELRGVRQKIQYTEDQFSSVRAMLEHAEEKRQEAKERLKECENGREK